MEVLGWIRFNLDEDFFQEVKTQHFPNEETIRNKSRDDHLPQLMHVSYG
jgi:hypothetical protein